jgi:hypothetical protein
MKMLHIVCGKGFEEEIVALFKEHGLQGYLLTSHRLPIPIRCSW